MRCFPRSAVGCSLGLIGFSLMIVTTMAHSAQPVDLLKVRDVICGKESRTVKTPERAVRHRLRRNAQGTIVAASTDLGFCQISVRMLEDMGFLAPLGKAAYRNAQMIFTVEGSKTIALEILAQRASDFPGISVGCLYIKYRWGKQVKCGRVLLADEDVQEVIALYNKALIAQR